MLVVVDDGVRRFLKRQEFVRTQVPFVISRRATRQNRFRTLVVGHRSSAIGYRSGNSLDAPGHRGLERQPETGPAAWTVLAVLEHQSPAVRFRNLATEHE